MKRVMGVVLSAVCWTVAVGPRASAEEPTDHIRVFVSIPPQAYFAERVGGDRVDVQVLVKPGHSPATYEPTPRQMAALSEADVYFRIGVPFENALFPGIEKAAPNLRITDMRRGIALRTMASHGHGHEGEHHHHHAHGGTEDPHIWLDPGRVRQMAQNMRDALIAIDPAHREQYERNTRAFAEDLDTLDRELADALAPVQGKTLLVFHPAWGYFADAYGLHQEAIEIEGKSPTGRQLARIIEQAKAEDIGAIFVQPQFSRSSAEAVARAIGAAVTPIDPLAREYMDNMRSIAETVRQSIEESPR